MHLGYLPDCGLNSRTELIEGGKEVEEKDWPWMASLRDSSNNHFCGAVFIKPNVLLSAAHCLQEYFIIIKFYPCFSKILFPEKLQLILL